MKTCGRSHLSVLLVAAVSGAGPSLSSFCWHLRLLRNKFKPQRRQEKAERLNHFSQKPLYSPELGHLGLGAEGEALLRRADHWLASARASARHLDTRGLIVVRGLDGVIGPRDVGGVDLEVGEEHGEDDGK